MTLLLFILGFVLLLAGAELLVKGASRLAVSAGVSTLVIGLTVVAYGTSAPELAVNVYSNFTVPPKPDLAIGNVVGSNIANVLLVLGAASVVRALIVSRDVVRAGVPLMVAVSLVFWAMAWNGVVGRTEGLLLAAGAVVYTVITIRHSRRETMAARLAKAAVQESAESELMAGANPKVRISIDLLLVAAGLVMLVIGSRWLVDGAVVVAEFLGVSELIIGLTVVAIGTSLPEVAASIVAVLRGERDLAVGNVVGSNLFNILMVVGVTATISPTGVRVSNAALTFDIPVMIVVAVACLPVFFTGYCIARWEGVIFLVYFAAYLTYLSLDAAGHDALHAFGGLVVWFVTPMAVLTFVLFWWRAGQRENSSNASDGGNAAE